MDVSLQDVSQVPTRGAKANARLAEMDIRSRLGSSLSAWIPEHLDA